MLTKIATSLIRRLQRKGVVSNEAEDIYVYGFELLVSFVFSTTLILTLAKALQSEVAFQGRISAATLPKSIAFQPFWADSGYNALDRVDIGCCFRNVLFFGSI